MKVSTRSNHRQPPILLQVLINFAIPIFILTRLSPESALGPTKSFLLALAFPVCYELYSVWKHRSVSVISIIVIVGILTTGVIGLLGLSENWLAIRRSLPYGFIAIAIFLAQLFKPSLTKSLLALMIDMRKVNQTARRSGTLNKLERITAGSAYGLSGVFFAVAIASYSLTKAIIVSPTGSEAFNEEYARLRIISLLATTVPLAIGVVLVVFYFSYRIKKITGLETDDLIKKK